MRNIPIAIPFHLFSALALTGCVLDYSLNPDWSTHDDSDGSDNESFDEDTETDTETVGQPEVTDSETNVVSSDDDVDDGTETNSSETKDSETQTDNGDNSGFEKCENNPICRENDQQERDCGNCGIQARSCQTDCTWGAWGECEPLPGCDNFCAGVLYEQRCWYLSGPGQSCMDICAAHGGYNDETSAYVGTPIQGGAQEICQDLFHALGQKGTVQSAHRGDGIGLGCHNMDGPLFWLDNPEFKPGSKYLMTQIVCSCNE